MNGLSLITRGWVAASVASTAATATGTTDYWTIRDNMILKIEALTPSLLVGDPFRRSKQREGLREWAGRTASTAVLRRFDVRRPAPAPDPNVLNSARLVRNETIRVEVAYPVDVALYGTADIDDIEKVMRSDARQIRDCIFSAGNYVDGQHAAFVSIEEPDQASDRVWFQAFTVEIIYNEAQSLV